MDGQDVTQLLGHKPTHKIDERRPEQWRIPDGAWGVDFVNIEQGPVDEAALRVALAAEKGRKDVIFVGIEWNSQMTSAWVAEMFPNAHRVFIEGEKIGSLEGLQQVPNLSHLLIRTGKNSRRTLALLPRLRVNRLELDISARDDLRFLNECQFIDHVHLSRYPEADLTGVSKVAYRDLIIESRRLRSAAGINCSRLANLRLLACYKVEDLAGVTVPELNVESCKRLPLTALSSVGGLKKAFITVYNPLDSFEFVLGCPELEELIICATRVHTRNFRAFAESTSLRRLFIALLSKECVRQISRMNPELIVENSKIRMKGGQEVPKV